MALRAKAVPENVPGSLYVDRSCICCGTCFHFAPEVFTEVGDTSAVTTQPADATAVARAHLALIACPTSSIGSDDRAASKAAARGFPHPMSERVWFNGYTQERSFGAWSYLIQAADGNVLMDSPRAARPLRENIDDLGGVSRMVLSHRDDIAGHELHAAYWGCPRIAHREERIPGVEQPISGDEPVALGPDLLLIPTPGHTRGSCCLLFEERALFSGDHLWWNPQLRMLSASKSHCWFDWPTQLASLEALLEHPFREVYPGHGAPWRAPDTATMHGELRRALERLRRL